MASNSPDCPQTPPNSPDHGNAHYQLAPDFAMDILRASDLLMCVTVCADVNKPKITQLAVSAVKELSQMAVEQDPLWLLGPDGESSILNDIEYKKRFGPLDATLEEIIKMLKTEGPIQLPNLNDTDKVLTEAAQYEDLSLLLGPKPFQAEASRATELVFMNPIELVNVFMDVDQWSILFANIVSNATVLGVLSTGEQKSPNGALNVMKVEFHVPSPLVQTRENYFARYCKQLAPETWVVVDVSLESIFPSPAIKYQRKPSGCLIQGMPNGYSKVTWVEHVEADNGSLHSLFTQLVSSGFAFGAKRWVATLARQLDRLAAFMDDTATALPAGRRNLMRLADRMMRGYYGSISASCESPWRRLPMTGAEGIMVMASYNLDDPGTPRGDALTVATSVWLPVPPKDVFDFLRDGSARNQWDLLSNGHVTRELVRIPTGRDPKNCVSVVAVEPEPNNIMIFYLQECYTDPTGSYVVYAPIDAFAMNCILECGNPEIVQILASGFAILPDRPTVVGEEMGGSILTVSFQIMNEYSSTVEYLPPNSVLTIYKLITETVSHIMDAVIT
ncbi:hypothetical protein F0562_010136 [Nyssa sinensis]|uniref:START domain-containing protein n=1 Tax=Nyssa sinensis TaxID=561372 RepID=A0A5J4ZY01_9ASTE|nr:hypothetical protein F0562_010136 [Nyssa sinensis]